MDEKEKTVTARQSRITIENSNSSIIIDDDGITINSKFGCVCNTNDFINALLKDENVQKAINNLTVSKFNQKHSSIINNDLQYPISKSDEILEQLKNISNSLNHIVSYGITIH